MGFKTRVVIPTYNAGAAIGNVVRDVREHGWDDVLVLDDGSTDGSGDRAQEAGARVVRHPVNRGKGWALRTALEDCARDGIDAMLTLDADGQHLAKDLRILVDAEPNDADALVLGIRDLAGAGAPRANQMSNRISNFFLSRFAGRRLADTNCGLRRYPVKRTMALDVRGTGYEMEAEVILRAAWAGVRIIEAPIHVHYPPEHLRLSHFRTRRDVPRVIFRVVEALATARR